ncbi:cysteine-rich receptor-like protein kinase 10, partial [Gastrolobium bilobum]|uniref:cysteine-rich receptor-like protein kinase 10 n=1 Tax=Gastrolobium bilobum TaxID=150636 RepID=UPI002AB04627
IVLFTSAVPVYNDNYCPNSAIYQYNITFQSNLKILLSDLTSNASQGPDGYYLTNIGLATINVASGIFLCRGDVASAICQECVAAVATEIECCCHNQTQSIIWYDECTLGYTNRYFNSVSIVPRVNLWDDKNISTSDLKFNLATIEAATNKFSYENKIGKGGFGEVYKGVLLDGREIAVKKLSQSSRQGVVEFKNEVLLIAKLQHRNLVTLLGFCLEEQEKMLIYEFVPNKSLDYFLFDPVKQRELDWSRRYKIIVSIARGILYLHEDSQLLIIHRDLKASNVLLDENMNPKISDFGMAKIFQADQTQVNTGRIVGTYGYMSPEYAMRGQFSVKSDVFSFGVLVLEIVSSKKNTDFCQTKHADDLLSYAWKNWTEQTPLELLDPTLRGSYSRNEVIRCIHIGLLCIQENPSDRPSMATISLMLNSYSVTLSLPRKPASFLHGRTPNRLKNGLHSDESATSSILWSNNEVSITEVYPR